MAKGGIPLFLDNLEHATDLTAKRQELSRKEITTTILHVGLETCALCRFAVYAD